MTDRDARCTRRGCACSSCCRADHRHRTWSKNSCAWRCSPSMRFPGVPRRRSVVRMSRAGAVPARIQAAQRCCAAGTRVEGSGHPITRLRFARGLQRCSYMLGAGLSLASDAPSTACQQHGWVRTPRSVQGYCTRKPTSCVSGETATTRRRHPRDELVWPDDRKVAAVAAAMCCLHRSGRKIPNPPWCDTLLGGTVGGRRTAHRTPKLMGGRSRRTPAVRVALVAACG